MRLANKAEIQFAKGASRAGSSSLTNLARIRVNVRSGDVSPYCANMCDRFSTNRFLGGL